MLKTPTSITSLAKPQFFIRTVGISQLSCFHRTAACHLSSVRRTGSFNQKKAIYYLRDCETLNFARLHFQLYSGVWWEMWRALFVCIKRSRDPATTQQSQLGAEPSLQHHLLYLPLHKTQLPSSHHITTEDKSVEMFRISDFWERGPRPGGQRLWGSWLRSGGVQLWCSRRRLQCFWYLTFCVTLHHTHFK